MNIAAMIDEIKAHPDYPKAGMILCHNGVVRDASREGEAVSGLRVAVDQARVDEIIQTHKKTKGIIEILVDINADQDLMVGDDVMAIVVAGDIRETVIRTLESVLNDVKSTATSKTQFFI